MSWGKTAIPIFTWSFQVDFSSCGWKQCTPGITLQKCWKPALAQQKTGWPSCSRDWSVSKTLLCISEYLSRRFTLAPRPPAQTRTGRRSNSLTSHQACLPRTWLQTSIKQKSWHLTTCLHWTLCASALRRPECSLGSRLPSSLLPPNTHTHTCAHVTSVM